MRPNHVTPRRQPLQSLVVLMLVALTGSACAGGLAKYRNAQPLAGTTLAAGEPAGPGVADSAAGPVDAAALPSDTAAGATEASAATMAPSGSGAAASGTGARSPRPASANVGGVTVGSGPAAGAAAKTATGAAGPTAAAGSAGTGPAGSTGSGSTPATPGAPAPDGRPGTTTGVARDTVAIGFFYPKTGAYSGLARDFPAVAQAAVDEAGPINGRRVVLKFYDDGTANASTVQVEEKRAKDEAFAFVSIVSESNAVLAPLAEQHKVPVLMGNIDDKVALPLTWSFPLFAYWTRQAAILPGFIKNTLSGGDKKIGIVYEGGNSNAVDSKNTFKNKAKQLGLNVIFEQPIAQNQSTCANEVANLQSRGVELVFMMNGPLGGICMLRDARALGYKPIWTGVGMSWNFNVVAQASGGGADGVRTLSTMTTLDTPAGRRFSEAMRKHGAPAGADSDDAMLLPYSLMQTTLEALRRAGPNLSREGFVQTMETKMNGYDSGYLPPPTFGPKIRYGPTAVGVSACCTGGKWTTPQAGWRAEF